MKSSVSFYSVVAILVAIIFFGSDIASAPVGEFGDVLENVPEYQPISGAEHATIRVEYDKIRSFFNIHTEHSDPRSDVAVDVHRGWGFLKNTPIEPDGTGVSWCTFVLYEV